MVHRKLLALFAATCMTLVLGYSDAIISSSFDTVYSAKFVQYTESPCREKLGDFVCGKKLSIQKSEILSGNGLFIGGMYPSGEISCDNAKVLHPFNPNDLVTLRQSKIGTILSDAELSNCSDRVDIRFYGTSHTKRFGLYTGRLVQAKNEHLERINEIYNFLQVVFPNILLGLFIALVLMAIVISRAYPRVNINIYICVLGCAVLAARSGTFGLIGIILENNNVSLQLSNFFIFAFSAYVSIISVRNYSKLNTKYSTYTVFLILFAACLYFRPAYCFVLAACVSLYVGLRHRNYFLLIAAVFFVSDSFKMLYGSSFLPVSYIAVAYYLFSEFFKVLAFTFKALTFTRHVENYNTLYNQADNGELLSAVENVRAGFEIYGITDWTLCLLREKGAQLLIFKDGSLREVDTETTPPVFARAISLGKAVINESESWKPLAQIKSSVSQDVYSGHFSIHPLSNRGLVLGALAINNPPSEFFDDGVVKVDFDMFIQATVDYVAKELDVIKIFEKDNWIHKLSQIDACLDPNQGVEKLVFNLNQKISETFDVTAVFALKTDASEFLDFRVVNGSNSSAEEIYYGLKTSVNSLNELGPIPLAIKTMRPVILSDVNFMKSWLQSKTLKMFELNSTLSASAIPIIHSGKLKGLIWLESKNKNFFHGALETSLILMADKIGLSIHQAEKIKQLENKEKLFIGIVPDGALEKRELGLPTKIKQFGEITMFDIRKSTALSTKIGAEKWSLLQAQILASVKPIIERNGYTLCEFTWDAIYVTKEYSINDIAPIEYLSFVEDISEVIASCISKLDASKDMYSNQFVRVCTVLGDISYDFMGLSGLKWGVVGEAIAHVSKVEQMAKTKLGDLFVDSRICDSFICGEMNPIC